MARKADVIVVGGGIMGACSALALAEAGVQVWLVEKRHPGAGSTGKSGAILRQHYSRAETVRMAREGLHFYRDLEQRYGCAAGFARSGMIFLAHAADRDALAANVTLQRSLGVPTHLVDEEELARLEPRGSYEEDIVGCFEEDSAWIDPRRAVEGLVAAAQRAGVRTSFGEAVTGLRREGARVRGVATSHGSIQADWTVLATGPWSVRLLQALQLGTLPLSVVRPQQAFLEPPATFGPPTPIFGDLRLGYYWKPEGPHHTRVGAMGYEDDASVDDPDDYDEGVSGSFVTGCRRAVAHRLPAYAAATAWGGCSALYTVTPDAHPVIGTLEGHEGVMLVTGFSGHGFKLAPAVGRGVAEWLTGGEPNAFPKELFDPLRFGADGRSLSAGYRYRILG